VRLAELHADMYAAFCDLADDFMTENDDRYWKHVGPRAFDSYLRQLAQFKDPTQVPEGYVASTSYFLKDDDGTLIGGIRFRPGLNKQLLIEGGNVGYDVRPSYRNRGFATRMLTMVLGIAREAGLTRVLVTCFTDNPASAQVIRKCGGVLESIEPSPRNGKMTERYWVSC
jgi:predicted acetyltransferase